MGEGKQNTQPKKLPIYFQQYHRNNIGPAKKVIFYFKKINLLFDFWAGEIILPSNFSLKSRKQLKEFQNFYFADLTHFKGFYVTLWFYEPKKAKLLGVL